MNNKDFRSSVPDMPLSFARKMDETLERMSVAEILGNCIFEMSYFGYDMKSWTRNVEERFGPDTE